MIHFSMALPVRGALRAACLFRWAFALTPLVALAQEGGQRNEMHRPQIHFSPVKKWMNDPNGLVFHKGVYHLFYQYYPDSTVWGPMHWGHAVSKDLVHWSDKPIALYPDSLGYIFSGSAVADKNNTSGFGKGGQPPLVAIFTHHDPAGEKAGSVTYQYQSLAYSLDDGNTWTKYAGNPVLKNPGIADFRDPKVMWYEAGKKWIMTLAVKDHISIYSSPNLKDWKKESDFGADAGAHGGVWECPDLFSLDHEGKKVWVLIVNINPGGPNGGSATQYFLGDFNGKEFKAASKETKWLDYGPDEYAGVTWDNTGARRIFIGWMSNWLYANMVPTIAWRNAMTVPRDLSLKAVGGDLRLASGPVAELEAIEQKSTAFRNLALADSFDLVRPGMHAIPCRIDFVVEDAADFALVLSNDAGEQVSLGFDKNENRYFVDRRKSGKTNFQKDFSGKHVAPRFSAGKEIHCSVIIDVSSVELFADEGLTVMTSVFFPNRPFDRVRLQSKEHVVLKELRIAPLNSIWPGAARTR